ncbi:MAG: thiamine phosphate synthase [Deltaproteobacteria bacterium]|nr:thiamine phosphate synthase [Deltaproteobacteria bacterium]
MHPEPLRQALKFYFITDDAAPDPLDQARCAIAGGATLIQFRQKDFAAADFSLARAILSLCRANCVPFVVNDHLLLAKLGPGRRAPGRGPGGVGRSGHRGRVGIDSRRAGPHRSCPL